MNYESRDQFKRFPGVKVSITLQNIVQTIYVSLTTSQLLTLIKRTQHLTFSKKDLLNRFLVCSSNLKKKQTKQNMRHTQG